MLKSICVLLRTPNMATIDGKHPLKMFAIMVRCPLFFLDQINIVVIDYIVAGLFGYGVDVPLWENEQIFFFFVVFEELEILVYFGGGEASS